MMTCGLPLTSTKSRSSASARPGLNAGRVARAQAVNRAARMRLRKLSPLGWFAPPGIIETLVPGQGRTAKLVATAWHGSWDRHDIWYHTPRSRRQERMEPRIAAKPQQFEESVIRLMTRL